MLLRAKSNWVLKICHDVSQPPWATYSSALLICCEISFPLYPVGISIVTIWICSFLSFHCRLQEESASVFSTSPYTQLKTAIRFLLSLRFSRLNKPGLVNPEGPSGPFLQLAEFEVPANGNPALQHTDHLPPRDAIHSIAQGSLCPIIQVTGGHVKLDQPHLNFEECHL